MHNRFCVTFVNHAPTGLNEANRRELCAQVNIIFHSAATVSDPPSDSISDFDVYVINIHRCVSMSASKWRHASIRWPPTTCSRCAAKLRTWRCENSNLNIKVVNEIFNEHLTASNKHEVACTLKSIFKFNFHFNVELLFASRAFFTFPRLTAIRDANM